MVTGPKSQEAIEVAVLAAIAKRLPAEGAGLNLDTPILAIEGMESVQVLRAVAEIEDTCGVFIPDDLLADAVTVRDLAILVGKLRHES